MTDNRPRFGRILLKLSGEALMGDRSFGIDPKVLKKVAEEIYGLHELEIGITIVVGGGNIFRGLNSAEYGMGRVSADHMGMLATVINAIALGEIINNMGPETRVMTALEMPKIAEPFLRKKALSHLEKRRILLIGAGTGNPYFSTDTAAALRAMETDSEVLLKATKVDGVFDKDPEKNASSKFFKKLTYEDVLKKNLKVMDLTAVSLAMEQHLPIIVFNLKRKGNIQKVVFGEDVGTLISGDRQ
jgi:uridylate kinase